MAYQNTSRQGMFGSAAGSSTTAGSQHHPSHSSWSPYDNTDTTPAASTSRRAVNPRQSSGGGVSNFNPFQHDGQGPQAPPYETTSIAAPRHQASVFQSNVLPHQPKKSQYYDTSSSSTRTTVAEMNLAPAQYSSSIYPSSQPQYSSRPQYSSQPSSYSEPQYSSQPSSQTSLYPESSPYSSQPSSSYLSQPSSAYSSQPSPAYSSQTSPAYSSQPSSAYSSQPSSACSQTGPKINSPFPELSRSGSRRTLASGGMTMMQQQYNKPNNNPYSNNEASSYGSIHSEVSIAPSPSTYRLDAYNAPQSQPMYQAPRQSENLQSSRRTGELGHVGIPNAVSTRVTRPPGGFSQIQLG